MDRDAVEKTPPPEALSRRDFLKLLAKLGFFGGSGLVLDSLLAHVPAGIPTLTEDFWKKLETFTLGMDEKDTRELKEKIEEDFYINIISPEERRSITVTSYKDGDSGQEVGVPVVEWSASELVTLGVSLINLPPKMYIPGRNYPNVPVEERVGFIMLDKSPDIIPDAGEKPVAFCKCGVEEGAVVLGRVDFPQIGFGRIWTKSMICHELTHKVVRADKLDLSDLGRELGVNDEVSLGDIFSNSKVRMGERAIVSNFPWPVDLEYGSRNFSEFVAVGAQAYLFGREEMCNIYSPFLGQERALRFYLWLERNVFDRVEYLQGKMVK